MSRGASPCREDYRAANSNEKGFSLVELMIVVAIMAVLSSVAIPAYVNYVNRSRQSDAITALMQARMEQEAYWADMFQYAGTIGCLPSFSTNAACLTNCGSCTQTSYTTAYGYSVRVTQASADSFRVVAQKQIYTDKPMDVLVISASTLQPVVVNSDALHFSIFDWVFK